jgi:hypothetical protein
MGCCGRARATLSRPPAPTKPILDPPSTAAQPVTLRYVGQSSFTVRGPGTGQHYAFSAAHPVQSVDHRDAAVFLRTNYFRQA